MRAAWDAELLRSIGIEADLIKSSVIKGQPNPLEALSDEARAALADVVADSYGYFRGLVADRRSLAGEKLDAVADGRVFTGRQALAAGLIDGLGGKKAALAWLEGEKGLDADLPIEDITPRPEDGRGLLGAAADAAVEALLKNTELSERLRVDGLVSVWQPRP